MAEKNKRAIIVDQSSIINERRKDFIAHILHKIGYDKVWLLPGKDDLLSKMRVFLEACKSCNPNLPDYYTEEKGVGICDTIADHLNLEFKTYDCLFDMIIDFMILEEEEKNNESGLY